MRVCSAVLCAVLLSCVAVAAENTVKSPQVYVYLRNPPENGASNEFICHCTNFYPPQISMRLQVNDQKLDDCGQSDLTFKEDWTYFTTMNKKIVYKDGHKYTCEVQHNDGTVKTYVLETSM